MPCASDSIGVEARPQIRVLRLRFGYTPYAKLPFEIMQLRLDAVAENFRMWCGAGWHVLWMRLC